MADVAADRDLEALDPAEAAADGERVEQGLGGMLAASVAGIDHRAVHRRRDVCGGAVRLVPDHQYVGPHRVQRLRGVDQALALAHARGGRVEVGDLGAEPLAGDLEREERAGRILEEGVDLGEAGEPFVGLSDAAVERDPRLGRIEDQIDVGRRKALDPEQMAMREGCAGGHSGRAVAAEGSALKRRPVPSGNRAGQRVDRALEDVGGGHLVDQLGAAGAAGVGVDQGAGHGLGRPALVPEQDRQAERLEVAGEGADRLGARRFAAVEVERQADDEPARLLLGDQRLERVEVPAEFGAPDQGGRGRDRPLRVAQRRADRLRADVEPEQPPALGQRGAELGWPCR